MIEFINSKESIFDSKCDVFVNPVNCEGISGKGLALEFKKKFPKNFKVYERECSLGHVKTGYLVIVVAHKNWNTNKKPKFIVNFPTKNKVKKKSKYRYIREGLERLAWHIPLMGIRSIAIPALGCGLGGLKWSIVKKIIKDKFGENQFKDLKIKVFEPQGS